MIAEVAYLDTSAVVKLLVREEESRALRAELERWPRRASSALLRVELLRTVGRAGLPALVAVAHLQLSSIHLLRLDQEVLSRAAELEPWTLRSLDAIHLASALALGEELGTLLTYDRRMAAGSLAIGIDTRSPN
ncbi:MAG: type II toxin-antitoxin system VapC family toxin [Candidatus Dormibacteria bacterium]